MKKFKSAFNRLWTPTNVLVFIVITTGMFLRFYQLGERFLYGHDQDLASWFVKDILVNNHLRLIGQETSTAGIFIGPIFYYLMTIFYKVFGMDPIGGAYLVTAIGFLGIISLYFVVNKIFGQKTAIFALIIYSISNYMVFNDREVVPTMPVVIWTIWFMYSLHLILKKNWNKGFLLAAVLTALIWHLNFALILTLPLIPITMFLSQKRLEIKPVIMAIVVVVLSSTPLILFELRHGFSQTRALFSSLTTSQNDVISGMDKFRRVFLIFSKNLHGLFIGAYPNVEFTHVTYIFLAVFVVLAVKKYLSRTWSIIFGVWLITFFLFFSTYSKIVSEYYVNGSLIVFIVVTSVALAKIYESSRFKHIAVILIALFCVFSVRKFALSTINESGYIERKQIISEIKRDSGVRGYPCVSISYITDAGYNLGYRYFLYLAAVKTKPISEFVPVYTIVFPLKPIFPTDQTRGAIGLIYPDYDSYNSEIINEKCAGDNYNLSEPMWGFPQ